MKKQICISIFTVAVFFAHAQEEKSLVNDQNPNYQISQQYYIKVKDSLLQSFNTTTQQTYKAYDWYEAKQERKAARIANRQQIRLARAQNPGFFNNYYPYFGYNNLFNQSPFFTPHLGFQNRNWWFWF